MASLIEGSKLEAVDKIVNQQEVGYAAEIVIKAMLPKIEKRLFILLDKFEHTPPDLPNMLDLRAQIVEVWRIKKELDIARADGKRASSALEAILAGRSMLNTATKGGEKNGATY